MSNLIKPHGSETLNPLFVLDDAEQFAVNMKLKPLASNPTGIGYIN